MEGLISASPIATIMANLMASTMASLSNEGHCAVFSSLKLQPSRQKILASPGYFKVHGQL